MRDSRVNSDLSFSRHTYLPVGSYIYIVCIFSETTTLFISPTSKIWGPDLTLPRVWKVAFILIIHHCLVTAESLTSEKTHTSTSISLKKIFFPSRDNSMSSCYVIQLTGFLTEIDF